MRALRRLGEVADGARGPVVYQVPVIEDETDGVWFKIGAAPSCDIVLENPCVLDEDSIPPEQRIANVHCFLLCTREAVTICRFRDSQVRINHVLMAEGHAVLSPTNVIQIGHVELAVCDHNVLQNPAITAVHLGETIETAVRYNGGDATAAANALNAQPRTLRRWRKKRQFWPTTVALALLCGSGAWFYVDGTRQDSATPSVRPAAAPVVPTRAGRDIDAPATAVKPSQPKVTPRSERSTAAHESSKKVRDGRRRARRVKASARDSGSVNTRTGNASAPAAETVAEPAASADAATSVPAGALDAERGATGPRFLGSSSRDELPRFTSVSSEDVD